MSSDDDPVELPRAEQGPEYGYAEADAQAHMFLAALAGGRQTEHRDDPIEHVNHNALLMLFSHEATEAFETFLERMPGPRRHAWAELLSGGLSSEAFGPLTLAERQDERQLARAMIAARRTLVVNTILGVLVAAAVVAGGWLGYRTWFAEETRTAGAIRLADPFGPGAGDDTAEGEIPGGSPLADPALTASISETIALLSGDGPVADRIVVPPLDALPYPPGSLKASLFEYAGDGYAAVVGPAGFAGAACLRVSVVTADLRPLDTVSHGPCEDTAGETVGRVPEVACLGPTALLLGIDIPSGVVELPEGGSGFADAVRIQLVADPGTDYELLTMRGTIEVPADSETVIPRFGGASGDTVVFELGDGESVSTGECTLALAAA